MLPFHRAALVVTLLIGAGCAWWTEGGEGGSSSDYVSATTDELGKGRFASAAGILRRAIRRFPRDEVVLRWSVELHRMQWNYREALSLLLELSRVKGLQTITRREVMGQIGDLLFENGDYGRSAHFLYSGIAGPTSLHRRSRADLTLALPYTRPQIIYRLAEAKIIDSTWPSVLCDLGDKTRLCVIDTGSTMSILSRGVAKAADVSGVRKFGSVRDSLGREHGADIGVLANLAIGGVQLTTLPILVVDDQQLALRDPFGGPEDSPLAILGLDVLSRFRLVLDYSNESVQLDRPSKLAELDSERCLLYEGCLVFPVRVDAVDMWFILDTAASHSSLTRAGLALLPGGDRRVVPDHRHTKSLAGRGLISRQVQNMVLQSSGVRFSGVTMPVVERATSGVFPVHGVFGVDLLRHCRLTMDSGRIRLDQVGSLRSSNSRKK